jgi:DNA polymerase-3 subunit delta'
MIDLHKEQLAILHGMLESGAQTILVLGDLGIGKKTLVRKAITKLPRRYEFHYPSFSVGEARTLKENAIRRTIGTRIYLIDGDYTTEQAYNAMLKLLEEPPEGIIVVITSSKPPLPTIVSRCKMVLVPPLTDEELKAALVDGGMSERAANSVVPYARGSITEALKVYAKQESKRMLIPHIKALKERDLTYVLRLVSTITREDISLLIEFVDDVLLSRYGLSNPEIASWVNASPDFLMKIKDALMQGYSPSLGWLRAWFQTE